MLFRSEWPGKSLTDILFSENDTWVAPDRNRAYMGRERHDLGRENDLGYPVRCIRTPEYLYIRNFEPSRYPAGNPETWYTNCDGGPTKIEVLRRHAEGDNLYYNLAFGKRPLEELYHIQKDPACMVNLANDESCQVIKEALWKELSDYLIETHDPRCLGNGNVFESYEYSADALHSWAHFLKGDWHVQKF